MNSAPVRGLGCVQARRSIMNAKMIGTTMVSFVAGMPEGDKQDVMDCLLYAELMANSLGGERDFSWISRYQYSLMTVGFVQTSHVVNRPLRILVAEQIDAYSVEIRGDETTQSLAQQLAQLLEALNIKRQVVEYLELGVAESRLSTFHCVPCEKTRQGKVAIVVCGMVLTCAPSAANENDRVIELNAKGGGLVFDSAAYAEKREEVQRTVRTFALGMIKDIEI